MSFTFGIPPQRQRREEKYPDKAVVTMAVHPEKHGAFKFRFNKATVAELNLDFEGEKRPVVSFGFNDNKVYIANTTGQEVQAYEVSKNNCGVSSRPIYKFTEKYLNLDTTVENEFELIDASNVQEGLYELRPLVQATEEATVVDAIEEDNQETSVFGGSINETNSQLINS